MICTKHPKYRGILAPRVPCRKCFIIYHEVSGKLTSEKKARIDSMSYEGLLSHWRFAPAGDPLFLGETGEYYTVRMAELRSKGADHVGASKRLGWKK